MVTKDRDAKSLLPALETSAVARVARQALGTGTARLLDWRVEGAGPNTGHATRGVYRVEGCAFDGSSEVSWSVILKVISSGAPEAGGEFEDEAHPLYWKREALAYTSGLLDSLPGGVRAPHCFEIVEQEDGAIWLWLEEVKDAGVGKWSIEQYARAAECLGRFNGAYLAGHPRPAYSWLVRTGSPRGLLEHNAWVRDVIADASTWEHPLMCTAFPVPVAEPLVRLWDEREMLLGTLDRLPQTFCHLDAWRRNMFSRLDARGQPELTLIDWAFPGFGAVGTDLCDLFGESFCLSELGDTEAGVLDEAVFGSYLVGLREAGWRGDAGLVRLAFTAFCSLKHLFMVFMSLRDVREASRQGIWENLFGRSYEEFVCREARLLYHLLGLADEARRLIG